VCKHNTSLKSPMSRRKTVEAAVTKCSKWLPGHDQAAAARAPVPEPPELKADIDALEGWVAKIRGRRR
jgi:hypothetical protein